MMEYPYKLINMPRVTNNGFVFDVINTQSHKVSSVKYELDMCGNWLRRPLMNEEFMIDGRIMIGDEIENCNFILDGLVS